MISNWVPALCITHLALLSWALSNALTPAATPPPRSPPQRSIYLHQIHKDQGEVERWAVKVVSPSRLSKPVEHYHDSVNSSLQLSYSCNNSHLARFQIKNSLCVTGIEMDLIISQKGLSLLESFLLRCMKNNCSWLEAKTSTFIGSHFDSQSCLKWLHCSQGSHVTAASRGHLLKQFQNVC